VDEHVLLVEDDASIREIATLGLEQAGFRVTATGDGRDALIRFRQGPFDLVVLDVMLPSLDGFEVCKEIRRESQAPIVMLTARSELHDVVVGLELGADDYVTKPFSHRELVARVRAQLRRAGYDAAATEPVAKTFEVGPIRLDVAQHSVTKSGQPVNLTVTEFRLLHTLMSEAGTVVPTRALLKRVWGYDDDSRNDVVRVTVHRLRRKLEDDPAAPQLLVTVAGVGVLLRGQAD
jgi:DNA-binding response OmpR family regulator